MPRPAPFGGTLPIASPPPEMAAFQIPTGRIWRTAAFGYRGGSVLDRREFVMTSILVKHPRGDLLIDTGFGRSIWKQLELFPWTFRSISPLDLGRPAAEQLAAAGYDRSRLRGILITHAHWDHTSGLADFPEVPVLVTANERRFIEEGGLVTAFARTSRDTRYEIYDFDGGPYLGFPRSRDLYGDGSIVIVPAPGHTPGSVIIFLSLPGGQRFALVGDLAWQREGITEREERPLISRKLADLDRDAVRANLVHMAAIAERFPEIILAPAHDPRGFARLPLLTPQR
jgi:glyoxylase-like metal-dependent hydrolase (beta-lactamase superfamily II)